MIDAALTSSRQELFLSRGLGGAHQRNIRGAIPTIRMIPVRSFYRRRIPVYLYLNRIPFGATAPGLGMTNLSCFGGAEVFGVGLPPRGCAPGCGRLSALSAFFIVSAIRLR